MFECCLAVGFTWFTARQRAMLYTTLQKQDAFHGLKILDTYSLITGMMVVVVVMIVVKILLIAVPMMLIRFFLLIPSFLVFCFLSSFLPPCRPSVRPSSFIPSSLLPSYLLLRFLFDPNDLFLMHLPRAGNEWRQRPKRRETKGDNGGQRSGPSHQTPKLGDGDKIKTSCKPDPDTVSQTRRKHRKHPVLGNCFWKNIAKHKICSF